MQLVVLPVSTVLLSSDPKHGFVWASLVCLQVHRRAVSTGMRKTTQSLEIVIRSNECQGCTRAFVEANDRNLQGPKTP